MWRNANHLADFASVEELKTLPAADDIDLAHREHTQNAMGGGLRHNAEMNSGSDAAAADDDDDDDDDDEVDWLGIDDLHDLMIQPAEREMQKAGERGGGGG